MVEEAFSTLFEQLLALFPDSVYVSHPAASSSRSKGVVDTISALATLAAAAAAVSAGWIAKVESDRAHRAEKSLAERAAREERNLAEATEAKKRALESQITAETYALHEVLGRWLNRFPWGEGESDTMPTNLGIADLKRWVGEFPGLRAEMDARALNLMTKGPDVPASLQASLNNIYVKYHFASVAVDKALDPKKSDFDSVATAIAAEHAARSCRDDLRKVFVPTLEWALKAHNAQLPEDELSKRRLLAIQSLRARPSP